MFEDGESLVAIWRYGILQTLDDYSSALRRGGVELARQVVEPEPVLTGSPEIDAGFAALTEYLAERDGWEAPDWVGQASRRVEEWFVGSPTGFLCQEAINETPAAFRRHGVFIHEAGLHRV